jgi:hypothetical protein
VRNSKGKLLGIKGHVTVHMARAELNALDSHEEDLLARLAAYVQWAGRYPTMLELNGLREGQLVPTTAFHPEIDRPLIERMFEKIRDAYNAKFVRLSEFR